MKTNLVLLASLSLLFSCASKSVISDTSKTKASTDIIIIQEVVSSENTDAPETKTSSNKMAMLTKELYESKNLYENSCSKCHKLYLPNEFTKEEWPSILLKMQKKSKLDDSKIAGIQDYINSQL